MINPLLEIPKAIRKNKLNYFKQFDVVNRDLKMPEKICILAPGINSVKEKAYGKITADYIIAVNYGAAAPAGKPINLWLVSDCNCIRTKWFKEINSVYDGIRCFSTPVCTCAVSEVCPYSPDKFYSFRLHPKTLEGDKIFHPSNDFPAYTPLEAVFRPDITCAGTAIRLAHLKGVKFIELCGVDMGNLYFDGTPRYPNTPERTEPDDCWKRLDSAIAYFQSKGIEIVSLSTTALKEPKCLF